jgi:hypothetical protein
MLRILVLALVLAAPAASAEQFRESAAGVEVIGDEGFALGEVTAVERNADGDIVAVEIAGLEPADAPFASSDMIAEEERDRAWAPTSAREDSARGGASRRTATR